MTRNHSKPGRTDSPSGSPRRKPRHRTVQQLENDITRHLEDHVVQLVPPGYSNIRNGRNFNLQSSRESPNNPPLKGSNTMTPTPKAESSTATQAATEQVVRNNTQATKTSPVEALPVNTRQGTEVQSVTKSTMEVNQSKANGKSNSDGVKKEAPESKIDTPSSPKGISEEERAAKLRDLLNSNSKYLSADYKPPPLRKATLKDFRYKGTQKAYDPVLKPEVQGVLDEFEKKYTEIRAGPKPTTSENAKKVDPINGTGKVNGGQARETPHYGRCFGCGKRCTPGGKCIPEPDSASSTTPSPTRHNASESGNVKVEDDCDSDSMDAFLDRILDDLDVLDTPGVPTFQVDDDTPASGVPTSDPQVENKDEYVPSMNEILLKFQRAKIGLNIIRDGMKTAKRENEILRFQQKMVNGKHHTDVNVVPHMTPNVMPLTNTDERCKTEIPVQNSASRTDSHTADTANTANESPTVKSPTVMRKSNLTRRETKNDNHSQGNGAKGTKPASTPEKRVRFAKDIADREGQPAFAASPAMETLRKTAELVGHLVSVSGELATAREAAENAVLANISEHSTRSRVVPETKPVTDIVGLHSACDNGKIVGATEKVGDELAPNQSSAEPVEPARASTGGSTHPSASTRFGYEDWDRETITVRMPITAENAQILKEKKEMEMKELLERKALVKMQIERSEKFLAILGQDLTSQQKGEGESENYVEIKLPQRGLTANKSTSGDSGATRPVIKTQPQSSLIAEAIAVQKAYSKLNNAGAAAYQSELAAKSPTPSGSSHGSGHPKWLENFQNVQWFGASSETDLASQSKAVAANLKQQAGPSTDPNALAAKAKKLAPKPTASKLPPFVPNTERPSGYFTLPRTFGGEFESSRRKTNKLPPPVPDVDIPDPIPIPQREAVPANLKQQAGPSTDPNALAAKEDNPASKPSARFDPDVTERPRGYFTLPPTFGGEFESSKHHRGRPQLQGNVPPADSATFVDPLRPTEVSQPAPAPQAEVSQPAPAPQADQPSQATQDPQSGEDASVSEAGTADKPPAHKKFLPKCSLI